MENYRADGGLSITMKHLNIDDHTSKGKNPMTEKFTKEKDEERKARTGLSSLAMTDAESAAVQKTPNRVSLDSIEAAIASIHYYTPPYMPHLTIAVVLLHNGWAEIGHSAPADANNYDPELGRKFAYENAMRKLWPLFGFALRDRLHRSSPPYTGEARPFDPITKEQEAAAAQARLDEQMKKS